MSTSLFRRMTPRKVPTILLAICLSIVVIQGPQRIAAQSQPNRILPPVVRGGAGDLWADVIIGKPDFTAISPNTTTASNLFWPHGAIVDRSSSPNKMYVYDAGNNRILGFDLSKCLAGSANPANCSADLVIGQKDAKSSSCNGDSGYQGYPNRAPASVSSLCGQSESTLSVSESGSGASMAVDAQGNLYVTDFWNHRVLKYNSPFTTDAIADDLWGQDGFTQNNCNKGRAFPDASTLCFSWGSTNNLTAGVDIDAAGNLWVTDSGNFRVLRFPSGSHTADLVLGQADFGFRQPGLAPNKFRGPSAVRVTSAGRVYVVDQGSNRVLQFDQPFTNGMTGREFGSGFSGPSGVDLDPNGGVWITNSNHNIIEMWDEAGQTILETLGSRGNANILGGSTGSIGIDSAGNKFVTVQSGELQNNLAMFSPGNPSTAPTRQLFGESHAGNNRDASGIGSVSGLAVVDNQLIVADHGRLLFWNDPALLFNGKPADGFAGGAASFGEIGKYGCCITLKADRSHHLWVSMSYDGSIQSRIEVFQLPLTTGVSPIAWITYPLLVVGGGTLTSEGRISAFTGLAPSDDGKFLWLSHSETNRVFRVRDPLTNPVVDVVLGQPDLTSTQCNRGATPRTGVTPDSLCLPGSLSLDRLGNLYVSDHSLEIQGNMRLLEFSKELFPADTDRVIFAPAASKIFPDIATWEPAFDAQNRMVVGYNAYWTPNPGERGRFPGVYNNPLSPSTTPDAFLNDYHSMAFAATFDDRGNLYVGDLDRSRVLIYKDPFGAPTSPPPLGKAGGAGGVGGSSRVAIPD